MRFTPRRSPVVHGNNRDRSRLRRPPLRASEFVASACVDPIAHPLGGGDHSAYIPDHGNCAVTARTLQGMARVRSGQAAAWPLSSDRSVRRGSGVKHDFACTFTRHSPPVLVALRSQSCLRLEGRARTLSGPSPDLSQPGFLHLPPVVTLILRPPQVLTVSSTRRIMRGLRATVWWPHSGGDRHEASWSDRGARRAARHARRCGDGLPGPGRRAGRRMAGRPGAPDHHRGPRILRVRDPGNAAGRQGVRQGTQDRGRVHGLPGHRHPEGLAHQPGQREDHHREHVRALQRDRLS